MAQYQVVELFDPADPDLPRAVFAARVDQSPWLTVWEHRNELDTKLARWFRALSDAKTEPVTRVLIGSGGIDGKEARAIAKFRIEQISKLAGTWPKPPDFLCVDSASNVGRRGRPVWADGFVYPSREAAARACGVTRRAIWDRMRVWPGWLNRE